MARIAGDGQAFEWPAGLDDPFEFTPYGYRGDIRRSPKTRQRVRRAPLLPHMHDPLDSFFQTAMMLPVVSLPNLPPRGMKLTSSTTSMITPVPLRKRQTRRRPIDRRSASASGSQFFDRRGKTRRAPALQPAASDSCVDIEPPAPSSSVAPMLPPAPAPMPDLDVRRTIRDPRLRRETGRAPAPQPQPRPGQQPPPPTGQARNG